MSDPDTQPKSASAPETGSLPSITVLGADRSPTAKDLELLRAARKIIEANPNYLQLLNTALGPCQINAGLEDDVDGYLYLTYIAEHQAAQEFWAHWGKKDRFNWHTGKLTAARA
jgi:hypothetical protein